VSGLALGLSSFLGRALALGQFMLRLAAHFHERIDQVVDRFMPLGLATHPDQGIEEIINGFGFFGHAAFYANSRSVPISRVELPAAYAVWRAT
jgi:hypothetical protein